MSQQVFIIGTGIAGVVTGLLLTRRGWKVTFLDHREPGMAASFGNAGSISNEAGLPEVAPEVFRKALRWLTEKDGFIKLRAGYLPQMIPWLYQYQKLRHPRHVAAISQALIDLVDHSNAVMWPLVEATWSSDLVVRTGALSVYQTEAQMQGEFESMEAYRQKFGRHRNFEMVSGDALRALEPDLPANAAYGLMYQGDSTVLNPKELVTRWYQIIRQSGGGHVPDRVVDLEVEDGQIARLVTGSGQRIDTGGAPVLIAAGAWSHELSKRVGHNVPLRASRGYHLSFEGATQSFQRNILFDGHGFMMTDMQTGLRFAGTVEFQHPDAPPSPDRIDNLRRRIGRFFPDLVQAEHTSWMGSRPTMPDSLPVISGAPRVKNAFFNFGHGSLGITQSAGAGSLVADLIMGQTPRLEPAPYNIGRFTFP